MPTSRIAQQGRSASNNSYHLLRLWMHRLIACCAHATLASCASQLPSHPITDKRSLLSTGRTAGEPSTHSSSSERSPQQALSKRFLVCLFILAGVLLPGLAKSAAQPMPLPSQQRIAIADSLRHLLDTWTVHTTENANDPDEAPVSQEVPIRAARIALYQHGELLGDAASWSLGHQIESESHPLNPLHQALVQAMAQAQLAVLPRPDALAAEQLRAIAPSLTLSIELAGPMVPLSQAELENPDAALRPGIEGMAVRHGSTWQLLFPLQQAMLDTTPSIEYPAMAARLLGENDAAIALLPDLAKRNLTFYRFTTTHIVSPSSAVPPMTLTRLGQPIELREISVASLAGMTQALIDHLAGRRIEPFPALSKEASPDLAENNTTDNQSHEISLVALGLQDTLYPMAMHHQLRPATPTEQAVAALSLLDAARIPQLDPSHRSLARNLARTIMLDLQALDASEADPATDGVAMAIVWVVLMQLGLPDNPDDPLTPLWTQAESMMATHMVSDPITLTGSVYDALLIWAMANRVAWERSHADQIAPDQLAHDQARTESDIRELYAVTKPGAHVGLMPWLGWAELALVASATDPIPAEQALEQIRSQVWDHQLSQEQAAPDLDFAGGIIFTQHFATLPSWNATRPLAFLATALAEPRLTSASDQPAQTMHLLKGMRFLKQLQFGPVQSLFSDQAAIAQGGIMAAPWDHTMPLEASSMTLLTLSEFLQSLAKATPHPAQTPTGIPTDSPTHTPANTPATHPTNTPLKPGS